MQQPTMSFEGQVLSETEIISLTLEKLIERTGALVMQIDPSHPMAFRLADVAADLASAYQRLECAEYAFKKSVGWLR